MSKEEIENAKFVCPICNSGDTEIEDKGQEIGFYCYKCGSWTKLSDKEDKRNFESHEQTEIKYVNGNIKDFVHWVLRDKVNFQAYHNTPDKDKYVSDLIEVYNNGTK